MNFLGEFTITVKRFDNHWWATLNENPGLWIGGDTLDDVVGCTALTYYLYRQYLADPAHKAQHEGIKRILQKPPTDDTA